MHIGIDFDNTIVCYDKVFYKVAVENCLIPTDTPSYKNSVRDYLRKMGNEDEWTRLQGLVYGTKMDEAEAFEGVFDFLHWCRQNKIDVSIVSHKSRYPYIGPKYDLHLAALQWMEVQGFFELNKLGLSREQIFFELTKADKIKRIADTGCTHFIDDLPELLNEPTFPKNVTRILFDPEHVHISDYACDHVSNWNEVFEKFAFFQDHKIEEKIKSILHHAVNMAKMAGFKDTVHLTPIACGGNNRVFQMKIGSEKFLLKNYFHSNEDKRDRLGAEFSFASFAWEHGLHTMPCPITSDPANFLGLYEFVKGRKLNPGKVNSNFVQQALIFYSDLNRNRDETEGLNLPEASEACFSIADHISLVDQRITRLLDIEESDSLACEAKEFTEVKLSKAWKNVREGIIEQTYELGLDLDRYLLHEDRCLSPSDFGFHNALLKDDGTLVFIDFEYAGWDDPAKMVCDFFCQPAVPVPFDFYQYVKSHIQSGLNDAEYFRQRVDLLLPAYRIKWCCIILNDFLPVDNERRKYAFTNNNRRELQLNKARKYLEAKTL
ncbi:MAG: phosphotransferase [Bacteroidetes bacterium]|jgi:hypothetical protein|nr:phosphotransferase [Bacteroidota bacterium]